MDRLPAAADIEERTRRKINRRLVPFLFCLYAIAYLDRANLSYASLEMTKELHFSNEVYGFGAGIFSLGYLLLEVPGAVLAERWSARKWIARIMISWGVAASLTGLISTKTEFYSVRFLLGVAEAGFFPGVVVYLTHWFRAEDRAKALAGLFAGNPVSQVIGAPLSAGLMNIHWWGLRGWRWLLILEGLPAVVAGIVVLFYLTDWPKNAKWLSPEERAWITNELDREKQSLPVKKQFSGWRALLRPDVLLLTAIWFLSLNLASALTLWLPKMVQKMSGYSPIMTTLVSTIPVLAALPFTLAVGWSSDRTGERRWHTAGCIFLAAAGLLLSRITGNFAMCLLGLTVAAMGSSARQAPFWSVSSSLLAGTTSAIVIAVMNTIGQVGSFSGPYIVGFLTDRTGTFAAGTFYLIGSAVMAGVLMVVLPLPKRVGG